jgi:hypothetical protein
MVMAREGRWWEGRREGRAAEKMAEERVVEVCIGQEEVEQVEVVVRVAVGVVPGEGGHHQLVCMRKVQG